MKRIALLAVIGGGLLALPGTAAADTRDCSFAGGTGTGPEVIVYGSAVPVGPGAGDPGADNALVGVCVDTNTAADGGYAEVGQGACYGVIDGSDGNPSGSGQGYAGFNTSPANTSCVSDTSKDPTCDGSDDASPSHNSGGCFFVKPTPVTPGLNLTNAVTAMFICGNTSGSDWRGAGTNGATRDGCSIP